MSAPRLYGPHDPTTVPATVLVDQVVGWVGDRDVEVPVYPGLLRQRRQLNERARSVALAASAVVSW